MALILRHFSSWEPKHCILDGELKMSRWSLGDHDMTLNVTDEFCFWSCANPFSGFVGKYLMAKVFQGKNEICH